ncbi:MAG: MoaD/ThiS family protein [Planctomycetota bacterium]
MDVLIPSMLHAIVGSKKLRVEAATLAGAIEATFLAAPALRFHLCEDNGKFRPHVLCFLNENNTREMKSLLVELKEGDEIAFVPAISGGSTS